MNKKPQNISAVFIVSVFYESVNSIVPPVKR